MQVLADVIEKSTDESVPEILNKAFLAVDNEVNQREGKFSGCTAIVAYIKVIDERVKKKKRYYIKHSSFTFLKKNPFFKNISACCILVTQEMRVQFYGKKKKDLFTC